MRILVLGHIGMLGSDVMKAYSGTDLHGLSIGEVDITNYNDLQEKVGKIAPNIVINCAAYTDVDGCETNVDTAFAVNADGVKNIAQVCKNIKARLAHISTDYAFDGNKKTPYNENDATSPISVYGKSKVAGEEYAKSILNPNDCLIIRTEWLFGKNGKNFVTTMLRLADSGNELKVVNDQFGAPTYTVDLALAIKTAVSKKLFGLYHVSNSGSTSWHGFAKKIFEYAKKDAQVKEIPSSELKRAAKRPFNSVFDLSKFNKDSGMTMPTWEDALCRYLISNGVQI